jgi:hypothetical protein
MDAPADATRVIYAEDAVGLTSRVVLVVALPAVIACAAIAFASAAVWSIVVGMAAAAEVGAAFLVVGCWVRGIRITDSAVCIGGCRRGDRSRVSPRSRFRREFVAPFDAIRDAVVVPRNRFEVLPQPVSVPGGRGRSRRRQALGDLRTPMAEAMLIITVDPGRCDIPPMTSYVLDQFAPVATASRFAVTDQWVIATRRPAELAGALNDVRDRFGTSSV